MLILGIDPGTATVGYGLLKVENKLCEVVNWGLIETEKNGKPEKRLEMIYLKTVDIINKYNPDVFAMEKLFFATNAKTAMRVSQAQGVLLYAAATTKLEVYEYAPGTIKKHVAGNGRANKKLVQQSVRKILGTKVRSRKREKTHFDNAADALAVALCHAFNQDHLGEK